MLYSLGKPCDSFEYEPAHDDPAQPETRFCACGWDELSHIDLDQEVTY